MSITPESLKKLQRLHELEAEIEEILGGGSPAADEEDEEREDEEADEPERKQGKGKRLNDAERAKIVKLHKGGMKKGRIGEVMGVSAQTVGNVVKAAKDEPDDDGEAEDRLEKLKLNILRMHRNGNNAITIAKMLELTAYEVKEIVDAAIEAGEIEELSDEDDDGER